jgi:hypothetical protein
VYCNEALSLLLDNDQDGTNREKKKNLRVKNDVLSNRRKKKQRTKDDSYNSVYYCAKSGSLVAS